jgi:putative peptidoglycan lipid II flippase
VGRWRSCETLFVATSVAALCLAIVCAFGGPQIVGFLGGGLDPASLQIARKLFLLMVPALALIIVAGIPRAMLHSLQSFVVPGAAVLLLPLSIVGAALGLSARFGIYSLALGTTAGTCLVFLILLLALGRLRAPRKRETEARGKVVGTFAKSIVPTLVCLSVIQIYLVIGRSLAAGLVAGSVAALGFSASIMSVPLQLF